MSYCLHKVEHYQGEAYGLAKAICLLPMDAIALAKMAKKHADDAIGLTSLKCAIMYHTMGTNLIYRPDEKEALFIRNREKMGERETFHKLHEMAEESLRANK